MNKNLLFLGVAMFSFSCCFSVFAKDTDKVVKPNAKAAKSDQSAKPVNPAVIPDKVAPDADIKETVPVYDKNSQFEYPYNLYYQRSENTKLGSVSSKDPEKYSVMLFLPIQGRTVEVVFERHWKFCIVENSERYTSVRPELGQYATFEDIDTDDFLVWTTEPGNDKVIDMNTVFILR